MNSVHFQSVKFGVQLKKVKRWHIDLYSSFMLEVDQSWSGHSRKVNWIFFNGDKNRNVSAWIYFFWCSTCSFNEFKNTSTLFKAADDDSKSFCSGEAVGEPWNVAFGAAQLRIISFQIKSSKENIGLFFTFQTWMENWWLYWMDLKRQAIIVRMCTLKTNSLFMLVVSDWFYQ